MVDLSQKQFRQLANKDRARSSQRFFKTGKGEYGEGDLFLGISSPEIRTFAKNQHGLKLPQVSQYIKSPYHEERLLGLIMLVNRYAKADDEKAQEIIYSFYIKHFPFINNWDLVDVSCPHVIGRHLEKRDKKILLTWAKSENFWTRRIAMVSNWWLIRQGDLSYVYRVAEILLNDPHDLIHKAVGWMLREAGKAEPGLTLDFIEKHGSGMPRTMLRYAIERFPEKQRKKLLEIKFRK